MKKGKIERSCWKLESASMIGQLATKIEDFAMFEAPCIVMTHRPSPTPLGFIKLNGGHCCHEGRRIKSRMYSVWGDFWA